MLALSIKICGISTPETLDAALRAGASHIGLVFFAKSPRNVTGEQAAALAVRARGKAKVVGLFVDPENAQLEAVQRLCNLDAIQLHGGESPARVAQVKALCGIGEVWKAIGVRSRTDLATAHSYAGAADRILYDAKPPEDTDLPGGTGLRIDWRLLAGVDHPLPWILAGGLDPANVVEAIQTTAAAFIDVSSGVESAPGAKDPTKIAAFCEAARSA